MSDTGVWVVCGGGRVAGVGGGGEGAGVWARLPTTGVPLRSCDGTGVVSVQVCAGRGAGA